jgi:micrococcal nuclease
MQKKRFLIFCLIIFLLAILSIYYPEKTGKTIEEYEKEPAFAIRIIDGDTIETDKGTIRLLGINAPEKNKPNYDEATNFLRQFENKSIEILRDAEDLDKYGRKLRYVFYQSNMINFQILEQGLATAFMLKGLKFKDKLQRAEDNARRQNTGLWKQSSDKCATCIRLAELNHEEEFFILQNTCTFSCNLSGWRVKDDANHFFNLLPLASKASDKYTSKNIWNNEEDRFFMRDAEGKLVLFYAYSSEE